MPTPPDAYVPWSVFEWCVGIILAANAASLEWFRRLFNRHLNDDNRRFELAEAMIERRHAENAAGREGLRAEFSKGNENLMSQMIAMRREIVDVLLQLRQ
jgi:hypothetical protein